MVKNCLPMQETQVLSLGLEDTLKKRMAIYSSISVWEIPWTEEPGELQSMGVTNSQTCLTTTMVVLFLYFKGISILFSIMGV